MFIYLIYYYGKFCTFTFAETRALPYVVLQLFGAKGSLIS